MKPSSPLIIAHRGASAFAPENTLEAFGLAFQKYDADMIEFDVRFSSDGVPVIIHDATLERTTNGKGYVLKQSLQDLKGWDAGYFFDPDQQKKFPFRGKGIKIPTLEELFSEFPDRSFAVEIKENSAPLVHAVMDLVRKYKLESRVVAGSKHDLVSKTLKEHFPRNPRFLSQREILSVVADYKRKITDREKDPFAVASMPTKRAGFPLDDARIIDYFHSRKMKVYFWTINDAAALKALAEKGADGLVTDHPGLAHQVLGRGRPSGTGPTNV